MSKSLVLGLMERVDWDGDGFVTPNDEDTARQKFDALDPERVTRADDLLGQARDRLVDAIGVTFGEFKRSGVV